MIRQTVKASGPSAPNTAPAPGAAPAGGKKAPRSRVPPSPLKPKANTRDYGKVAPAPQPSVDPFSGALSNSRLGGI